MFKKIILTLIGVGLLLGFQATVNSDAYYEKLTIADSIEDEKSSENCELEDLKFFNYAQKNLTFLKATSDFAINQIAMLQKNFLEVPTSPPCA